MNGRRVIGMEVEILEAWYVPGEGWYIEFTKEGSVDVHGPFLTCAEFHAAACVLWGGKEAA